LHDFSRLLEGKKWSAGLTGKQGNPADGGLLTPAGRNVSPTAELLHES